MAHQSDPQIGPRWNSMGLNKSIDHHIVCMESLMGKFNTEERRKAKEMIRSIYNCKFTPFPLLFSSLLFPIPSPTEQRVPIS